MKIYLITDTHFEHTKLIDYGRHPNFNEMIWKGLENLPDDCVLIHLGDFCMGNEKKVHARFAKFPFKKILIRGNHDHNSDAWYIEHGWDFVCKNFTNDYFGHKLTFSHIPIEGIKHWNIHGHFHDSDHRRFDPAIASHHDEKYHKLLAIEYTNYQPVELEEFIIYNRKNNDPYRIEAGAKKAKSTKKRKVNA